MVCGVFQQIKNIHHSSLLYENSDFPTSYPKTFSSHVYHQGAYRFVSPVLQHNRCLKPCINAATIRWHNTYQWQIKTEINEATYYNTL